jgi:poly(3-hydroxybutyrate) depolymerase
VPLCQNGLANQGTTGNDATGCTNNTEVQFIWEQGVGHNWETQNDTTKWLFFASHPKQPQ